MGEEPGQLLRAFPLVDFADELPAGALSVLESGGGGGGGGGGVDCGRTGLVRAGRSRVLWQLVHARGAWQLVLGRLRLAKPHRGGGDDDELHSRAGDLERACETAVLSVLLPREVSGARQAFRCCAVADPEGAPLVVYAVLAADGAPRVFRLEVPLPPPGAPFDLGLAHGLRPTHDAVLEGARAAALDAVDTATCVYGTDEGHAVAVCFPAQQPTPHVVPLGEAGAGVLAFFGRGQAAAAVVVISSCLCDGDTGAIVSAVHADGKVTVWQLALAGPATSSQVLFQQQLDVRSLRVTKGVVQSDAASDGGVRVLVAVTTDGNTTAATLWHLDPQRREQPRSVAVESPPADGEMLGVQVIGENPRSVVVFLMRSAADKLVLLYRNRQAHDSLHWMRGLVSDADSARAASAVEDPCLLIADLQPEVGDQLVIATHTCLLLVIWDSFHPLEVDDSPDHRSPLATLARTLYRGLTDEDHFARCRQDARASFAGQLLRGEQRPLQIAMSALAGLKHHSHEEAVSFLCRDDGSALRAVLSDIDSVVEFFGAGVPQASGDKQPSSELLLCGALQRQYCKRISESRLDLAQDMLYCLAYMLRHRLVLQSQILPTVLQQKYLVRVDRLVRSHMALCYLAGRKFVDDGVDLEERFSSLRIALPCKYVLGSYCVWTHLGVVGITAHPNSLSDCLRAACATMRRAIPIAAESIWNAGVCSLARGLCCNGVNRPEVVDKLLELLDADASHMENGAIQWRVEIHKIIGQSYARLGRFSDARRHFLGAAKPLLLAPVAQFAAEDCDVNVLAEIDEMMDSLEQDPASSLELSSLALRIEAYIESTLEEETGWKARLLSKTFGYALKINDIESAYHAMTSNPDQEKRTNSLKMLVHALHKSKQLEILFDKPLVAAPARFSHADSRNSVGVCLHGEVATILLERARAGGDEYFKSLYAFHVKQQNMQKAAEAMYALSERCTLSGAKNDDPDDYRRATDYLMVAISSLRACPDPVRWIERHHIGAAFDLDTHLALGKGGKRKLAKTGFQNATLFGDNTTNTHTADSMSTDNTNSAVPDAENQSAAHPLHITALEGEHALLTAR